jgi:hypothetical protein
MSFCRRQAAVYQPVPKHLPPPQNLPLVLFLHRRIRFVCVPKSKNHRRYEFFTVFTLVGFSEIYEREL